VRILAAFRNEEIGKKREEGESKLTVLMRRKWDKIEAWVINY